MKISVARFALLGALLLAAGAGCGWRPSDQGSPGPSKPPPGTIEGTYVVTDTTHPAGQPVDGVTIGLFLEPFSNLGNQYAPTQPQPIARVVTHAGGTFTFSEVLPGRYFIAATGVRIYAPGQWVTVTRESGAQAKLVGYADSPPPA